MEDRKTMDSTTFSAEFQRRLRYLLAARSGRDVSPEAEVSIEVDTRDSGGCETCAYTYKVLVLTDGYIHAEWDDIEMSYFLRLLDEVPDEA